MCSHCVPNVLNLRFSLVIYGNQRQGHFINGPVNATEDTIYNLTLPSMFLAAIPLSAEAVYSTLYAEK